VIIASHGFDRAADYGNIAAAAGRVEAHGAHHRRHRPAHHHLQSQEPLCVFGNSPNRGIGFANRVMETRATARAESRSFAEIYFIRRRFAKEPASGSL